MLNRTPAGPLSARVERNLDRDLDYSKVRQVRSHMQRPAPRASVIRRRADVGELR